MSGFHQHETIESARAAMADAIADTAADFGEEGVEAAYGDLVHVVAADCSPEVKAEFLRTEGFGSW